LPSRRKQQQITRRIITKTRQNQSSTAMATAGHFAIQTPRSDAQTLNSINADDLSFGSQEASFVSPSKAKPAPQKFMTRLQKPTGTTPLAEIKNNARPRASEFTPMLKSVTKNQFLKRGFTATPSRLRQIGKRASTSNLPEMTEMDEGEFSGVEGVSMQNEQDLAEMSSASVSFQSGLKLPARSPGSNDGAALMTLREQEKVYSFVMQLM
jgi:hypothetical protein